MSKQSFHESRLELLFEQVLDAFRDPFCKRERIDNIIASIIRNINFFQNTLDSSIKLEDFIQSAKSYFMHERYAYGSVLIREKDPADKLYIVLKGNAMKVCQRPYEEIEKELQSKMKTSRENKKLQSIRSIQYGYPGARKLVRETSCPKKMTWIKKSTNCFITEPDVENEGPRKLTRNATFMSKQRKVGSRAFDTYFPTEPEVQTQESLSPLQTISEFGKTKGGLKSRVPSFQASPLLGPKKISESDEEQEGDDNVSELNSMFSLNKKASTSLRRVRTFHEFVEDLTVSNPNLREKFFKGNINRVMKMTTYSPGQCFGENSCRKAESKEYTMVAVYSEEIHFLTITRESFRRIMSELYRKANEKMRLFRETFPLLNEDTIKTIASYFSQKCFKKGETIYSQKEPAREMYLLQQGDVNIFKKLEESPKKMSYLSPRSSPRKGDLPVASIIQTQFFGEELILEEEERQYSALSKSNDTLVYYIDLDGYEKIKKNFSDILRTLIRQAEERFAWRQQRVVGLLQQQKQFPQRVSDFSESPRATGLFSPQSKVIHIGDTGNIFIKDTAESSDNENGNLDLPRIGSSSSIFTEDSGSKARLYKAKFSRNGQIQQKVDDKVKVCNTRKELGPRKPGSIALICTGSTISEVNFDKELQEKKLFSLKLPKFASASEIKITPVPKSARNSEKIGKEAASIFLSNFTDKSDDSAKSKNWNSLTQSQFYGFDSPQSSRGEIGMIRIKKLMNSIHSDNGSNSQREDKDFVSLAYVYE